MGPCALCLKTDRPITREHVFARWLIARLHGARLAATAAPPGPPAPRISRVIVGVCPECNAGWMSSLEVSFRQAVFARPRVGPLHAPDRVTISRWFAKTAVLLAHAHGAALIPPPERPRLITGMPDEIEVFLARRRRPRQRLDYAIDAAAVEDDLPRANAVVVVVDDLVAHVARQGTLSSRKGTRLWPLRTHALRWETLPVITAAAVR